MIEQYEQYIWFEMLQGKLRKKENEEGGGGLWTNISYYFFCPTECPGF